MVLQNSTLGSVSEVLNFMWKWGPIRKTLSKRILGVGVMIKKSQETLI